ncbi:phosphotransferase family protein [Phytohabitans sp. LJ34]|uniref:phosphotransferase family protein n=1 Tax=Phytohabitans sp. LJ34 TaxID=3452217 RepID=UPI003F8B4351
MLGSRLGEGREAEVYAHGNDAVVKLYRPGYHGHRAEASALSRLDGHGLAPALMDVVDHDGRTGLVLERVPGPDMLTLLRRQPWRVARLARALATAHLAIHGRPAPTDLPDLRQTLAARIDDAPMPADLRGFARRVLDGLPAGERLCHGDFHPGNVLVAAERVAVIDWPNATRGAPAADHARTLLLLRRANPLPGTPLASRALIAAGRAICARAYRRAYDACAPTPPQHVDSWLTVHAAARLGEGIDAETATLIRILERGRRRSSRHS